MSLKSPIELAKMIKETDSSAKLDPCTEADIAEIESTCNLKLPKVYKEFLKSFGRFDSDLLFTDVLMFYPHILKYQEDIRKIEGDFKPSKSVYAFVIRDIQYLYFDTAELKDDPPIYHYFEYEEPKKAYNTFTEWLNDYVRDEIKACIENAIEE